MQEKKSKGKWYLIIGVIITAILAIIIIANGGVKNANDNLKNKADSLQNSVDAQ